MNRKRDASSRLGSVATSWVRVRVHSSFWLRKRHHFSDGGDGGGRLAVAAGRLHRQAMRAIWVSRRVQTTWQKKVVGKSEKELFEALEFSDKVLDEKLEVGGSKRNMDKREVVPTMKGRRPVFDLKQKERGIVAGARHLGGRFTWNGNNREELFCRKKGRYVRRGSPWASSGQ